MLPLYKNVGTGLTFQNTTPVPTFLPMLYTIKTVVTRISGTKLSKRIIGVAVVCVWGAGRVTIEEGI